MMTIGTTTVKDIAEKQMNDDDLMMNESDGVCLTMMQIMLIMFIGYGMIRIIEYIVKLIYTSYVEKFWQIQNEKLVEEQYV